MNLIVEESLSTDSEDHESDVNVVITEEIYRALESEVEFLVQERKRMIGIIFEKQNLDLLGPKMSRKV